MNRAKIVMIAMSSLLAITAAELPTQKPAGRVPVLLELFTSEGCSSCPPADRLLEDLDRKQPVSGAEAIVLSEHVDYWNYLGWSDPYSSAVYSQRQHDYAVKLATGETYTPQLVVDGKKAFVGSNRGDALSAIAEAARTPKLPIAVAATRDGGSVNVHIETDGAGVVYLVLASEREQSSVARGENAGRELGHVAVAYAVKKLGAAGPGWKKDLRVTAKNGATRVIVFLQDAKTGAVMGVGQGRV